MNGNTQKMNPDPQREAALFQAAAQLTGAGRVSFLDNACQGDANLRRRLDALLAAHERTDGALADASPAAKAMISLCPDGSRLAISSESERGVDIWDFKTGTRLYSLPEEAGTVYWLSWAADSRRVAVARDNGNIAIWDLDTVGQTLAKLALNP